MLATTQESAWLPGQQGSPLQLAVQHAGRGAPRVARAANSNAPIYNAACAPTSLPVQLMRGPITCSMATYEGFDYGAALHFAVLLFAALALRCCCVLR